jgi:hypothetical protein
VDIAEFFPGPDLACFTAHCICKPLGWPNMLFSASDDELVEKRAAEYGIVAVELNPGNVSIRHPHLLHHSEPNTSSKRRCGLDIGYISASHGSPATGSASTRCRYAANGRKESPTTAPRTPASLAAWGGEVHFLPVVWGPSRPFRPRERVPGVRWLSLTLSGRAHDLTAPALTGSSASVSARASRYWPAAPPWAPGRGGRHSSHSRPGRADADSADPQSCALNGARCRFAWPHDVALTRIPRPAWKRSNTCMGSDAESALWE